MNNLFEGITPRLCIALGNALMDVCSCKYVAAAREGDELLVENPWNNRLYRLGHHIAGWGHHRINFAAWQRTHPAPTARAQTLY
jgi:hypothetical protein